MTDKTIDLDRRCGMEAQKATDLRRLLTEVEANERSYAFARTSWKSTSPMPRRRAGRKPRRRPASASAFTDSAAWADRAARAFAAVCTATRGGRAASALVRSLMREGF